MPPTTAEADSESTEGVTGIEDGGDLDVEGGDSSAGEGAIELASEDDNGEEEGEDDEGDLADLISDLDGLPEGPDNGGELALRLERILAARSEARVRRELARHGVTMVRASPRAISLTPATAIASLRSFSSFSSPSHGRLSIVSLYICLLAPDHSNTEHHAQVVKENIKHSEGNIPIPLYLGSSMFRASITKPVRALIVERTSAGLSAYATRAVLPGLCALLASVQVSVPEVLAFLHMSLVRAPLGQHVDARGKVVASAWLRWAADFSFLPSGSNSCGT